MTYKVGQLYKLRGHSTLRAKLVSQKRNKTDWIIEWHDTANVPKGVWHNEWCESSMSEQFVLLKDTPIITLPQELFVI